MKPASPVPARRMLLIVIGFIIWSVAFVALYGVNAIGCAFGWPDPFQRAVLLGLYCVHLVLLAGLSGWTFKRWKAHRSDPTLPAPMLEFVGLGLMVAALCSTAFSLFPALFVTMCIP